MPYLSACSSNALIAGCEFAKQRHCATRNTLVAVLMFQNTVGRTGLRENGANFYFASPHSQVAALLQASGQGHRAEQHGAPGKGARMHHCCCVGERWADWSRCHLDCMCSAHPSSSWAAGGRGGQAGHCSSYLGFGESTAGRSTSEGVVPPWPQCPGQSPTSPTCKAGSGCRQQRNSRIRPISWFFFFKEIRRKKETVENQNYKRKEGRVKQLIPPPTL